MGVIRWLLAPHLPRGWGRPELAEGDPPGVKCQKILFKRHPKCIDFETFLP